MWPFKKKKVKANPPPRWSTDPVPMNLVGISKHLTLVEEAQSEAEKRMLEIKEDADFLNDVKVKGYRRKSELLDQELALSREYMNCLDVLNLASEKIREIVNVFEELKKKGKN